MSSASIIEIKGISKKYNITHQRGGYIALRDVLTNILKSPFRYFAYKAKSIVGKGTQEEFWALKDVSVSINQGEVVGIIGSNGAGKSTLLKILTGITPPTEGEIIMRGKVASLLEVGTGFHPELTGRENIFLNGAILGMTRKEIASKFDEIVAFSGIEQFLDTPVKYYSSGMYVRLAFSVAAHMEPDILLVDEVLAVGDAEFQKKCLGKMEEVTHGKGRTILFVSHNMAAIQQLCQKTILLEKGRIKMFGETRNVIHEYVKGDEDIISEKKFQSYNNHLALVAAKLSQDGETPYFLSTKKITLDLDVRMEYIDSRNVVCGFVLYDEKNKNILSSYFNDLGDYNEESRLSGLRHFFCEIPENILNDGNYRVVFDVGINGSKKTEDHTHFLKMTVKNIDGVGSRFGLGRKWRDSAILPYFEWKLSNNNEL